MTGIEATIVIILSSVVSAVVAFLLGYRLGGLGEREMHRRVLKRLDIWRKG